MPKINSFVLSEGAMTTKRIVVPIDTIDFSSFTKNPVMLYNHGRGWVPGRWENVRVDTGKLMGDPVFDDADAKAVELKGKVERGFIKGASLGIRNVVAVELEDADGKYWKVTKCELREVSIVDIPADVNALMLYDSNDNEVDLSNVELSDIFQTKISKTKMDKKLIAAALGLSDDVSEADLQKAIETNAKAAKELVTLKTQMETQRKAKAVSLCDEAVKDGRMQEAAKEGFLKLADADFDAFENTLKGLTKPVSLVGVTKKGKLEAGTEAAGRKEWTFSDWQKKDPKGLDKLMSDNPEEFQKLYSAEFGD